MSSFCLFVFVIIDFIIIFITLHQHTRIHTPEHVSPSEGGVSTQQPPAFTRPTLTVNADGAPDERVCHRLN